MKSTRVKSTSTQATQTAEVRRANAMNDVPQFWQTSTTSPAWVSGLMLTSPRVALRNVQVRQLAVNGFGAATLFPENKTDIPCAKPNRTSTSGAVTATAANLDDTCRLAGAGTLTRSIEAIYAARASGRLFRS